MKTDTKSGVRVTSGILLLGACNGQIEGCRGSRQWLRAAISINFSDITLSGTVFGLVVILSQLCFNFGHQPLRHKKVLSHITILNLLTI